MPGTDPVDIVAVGYDRLATRWDTFAEALTPPLRERYLDWLEARLADGSRVLELGSGTGRPVASTLASGHDYLGIDVSPEMISIAARNVPGARFHTADMRYLDLPAREFDAVIAFYSIIHVPRVDQPGVFSKIHRWLRPGGLFVGCLTSGDLEAGEEADWHGAGRMFWSGYDADTNRQLLTDHGFEVIDASVIAQLEGDQEVRFLWVTAKAGPGVK